MFKRKSGLVLVLSIGVVLLETIAHSVSLAQGFRVSTRAAPAYRVAMESTDRIIVKLRNQPAVARPLGAERMKALSAQGGVSLQYFRVMSSGAHVLHLPNRLPVVEV